MCWRGRNNNPWELPFSSLLQDAVKFALLCCSLCGGSWLSLGHRRIPELQWVSAGAIHREPCQVSKGVRVCSCRREDLRIRQTPLTAAGSLSSHSQAERPWVGFERSLFQEDSRPDMLSETQGHSGPCSSHPGPSASSSHFSWETHQLTVPVLWPTFCGGLSDSYHVTKM